MEARFAGNVRDFQLAFAVTLKSLKDGVVLAVAEAQAADADIGMAGAPGCGTGAGSGALAGALWLAEYQIEWRRSQIMVLKCTLDGHLLPHFGDLKSIGQVDFSAGKLMLCRAPDMNRADRRDALSRATR